MYRRPKRRLLMRPGYRPAHAGRVVVCLDGGTAAPGGCVLDAIVTTHQTGWATGEGVAVARAEAYRAACELIRADYPNHAVRLDEPLRWGDAVKGGR